MLIYQDMDFLDPRSKEVKKHKYVVFDDPVDFTYDPMEDLEDMEDMI